jgi:putative toxin-antitoxin system antitoxin component (TIGR02293 family)
MSEPFAHRKPKKSQLKSLIKPKFSASSALQDVVVIRPTRPSGISNRVIVRIDSSSQTDIVVLKTKLTERMKKHPIYQQAIEVFGSEDQASLWIDSPILALENRRPRELLESKDGAVRVSIILGRIAAGTY